jgi:predicted dinucleotide-binding enzyme
MLCVIGGAYAMRILIIGAGEVGYHIATRLVRERHDVVVVSITRQTSSHGSRKKWMSWPLKAMGRGQKR